MAFGKTKKKIVIKTPTIMKPNVGAANYFGVPLAINKKKKRK